MFGKFLKTPECMRVLSWLLSHPDDNYSAAIIAIECDMEDMATFMAVISILEGVGFIKIDDLSSDELMFGLDKENSSTQLLLHLKDEFNDCAFSSEQVSPSLAYLHSVKLKETIDSQIFNRLGSDEIIDMCKNYKDLDGEEDDVKREIINICSKLEETGEYEDFIERLEKGLEK